ncbi:MAG: fibrobacter succinogenes major paralogous domain-containing protein [Flavobacteriales bacterium]
MKIINLHLIFMALSSLVLFNSCDKGPETVVIGGLEWSTKNLDVKAFKNGEAIPEAKTPEEWFSAYENSQPAWCYFNNEAENGETHGVLYNWYAVNDSRGLAPEGWHVSTSSEWQQIIDKLGGEDNAGKAMKSLNDWKEHTHADNSSGLNCMAGGRRDYQGKFFNLGVDGYFWCQDQYDERDAKVIYLNYLYPFALEDYFDKNSGFSVRCVKD